ncbi:hypothetical protein GCK32_011377 [Trichostrongylus colubriformis]|uniref:Uncharacterized protein n=1 Tax=Trichostrongylus colubriformis TaxID=6319 RepID=A0AAN8EWQ4_TRICO
MSGFDEADALAGTDNVEQSYLALKKRYDDGDRNVELLWRLTRATIEVGEMQSDLKKKREYVLEGKKDNPLSAYR